MHRAAQVALIEFIAPFVAVQCTFKIEMAEVDITIEEHLVNPLRLVSRGMEGLFLCHSELGSRCANRNDSGAVHLMRIVLGGQSFESQVFGSVETQLVRLIRQDRMGICKELRPPCLV